MEIDSKEQEAPRDANFSTLDIHPSDDKDEPVELVESVDRLRDAADLKNEHQVDIHSLDWSY